MPLKTRFAPSPTGYMHLGNVRTALFNALLAHREQGIFLLRIEDTDQERNRDEYREALLEDLRWLGLEWQEGPEVGGEHGPYCQSERVEIYRQHFRLLESKDRVYPCFCTLTELAMVRKAQLAAGQPPRYPGTCARLTESEKQARWDDGLPSTLRFRVPLGRSIEFNDLVRGPQHFKSDAIGDFSIRRADGSAQFFFSNALDDALMGVTHVLRGEDHLANTPRQLLLLEALELPAPTYGHITLLVGSDGSPLSKRYGSRSLRELRAQGYLPKAVLNYLARLGHTYEHEGWLEREALAAGFATERLGRAPARYDEAQLLHWQGEAVSRLSAERLWEWLGEAVHRSVPAGLQREFSEALRPNIRFPQDALLWAQRLFDDRPLPLTETEQQIIAAAGAGFFQQALAAYAEHGAAYKPLMEALKARTGATGKALFMPFRVALTGASHGPELARLLALMPSALVRRRLQAYCSSF